MERADARAAARGLAGLRVLIGAVAILAPTLALRGWAGREVAEESGGRLLGRSLGARDIALGAGVILAQRHDAPVRGWVEAGYLADIGDLASTLLAFKELPRLGRWGVLAMTAGAIALGAAVSPAVDKA